MMKPITDELFDDAYLAIAMIIVKHGDTYLPIFERMQQEKQKREAQNDLKRLAAKVATQGGL